MTHIKFSECLESVRFSVEELGDNPFELLGRWTIRAEQDPSFNRGMIKAVRQYISDNGIKWDK